MQNSVNLCALLTSTYLAFLELKFIFTPLKVGISDPFCYLVTRSGRF